ncbi:MAG: hypothetical protein AAGA80_24140 [Cyanobacteria bacterium P01_F01_bin.143]
MVNESKIIFLIEKMQPTLFESRRETKNYRIRNFLIGGLIFGLFGGLSFGPIFRLIFGLIFGMFERLSFGLIFGLIGGAITGLPNEISLFEQMIWSWQKAKSRVIQDVLFGGLSFGLSFGLIVVLSEGLSVGLIFGLIFGLSFGLIFGLIVVLSDGLSFGLIVVLSEGLSVGLIFGLFFGLIFGLFSGLINGGATCIQHFNLRRILYLKGRIPWNYAHFLDYASERLLMKKVGGGYVFYHRMLMEHFAQRKLD